MAQPSRQLHLNLLFNNAGNFTSAWRWPDSDPGAFIDVDYYVRTAQLAERGTFDAVFFSDGLALGSPEFRPFQSLEPTILLASIAAATRHIGLIPTISSSYNEPFNIARRISTLDHVSHGRAGINVVTSAAVGAALNFGQTEVPDHGERYARGAEFIEVLQKLWDSWEDDALVGDKASGRLVDPARLHAITHRGTHFAVQGPLTVPRSAQGRPIIVQAGGSNDGLDLAARSADLVFASLHKIEEAKKYASELGRRAQAYGRRPDAITILPGLVTVIGSTEAEARARAEALWQLVPLQYGLEQLAGVLGVDSRSLKLDERLPQNLQRPRNGTHTAFERAETLAREGNLTVRELIKSQGGGATLHRIIVGTPEQVADSIEEWFNTGYVGGFNVVPDVVASGLEIFVDEVVPLLRQKGIFRSEYRGRTLREHYGLPRPVSQYSIPASRLVGAGASS